MVSRARRIGAALLASVFEPARSAIHSPGLRTTTWNEASLVRPATVYKTLTVCAPGEFPSYPDTTGEQSEADQRKGARRHFDPLPTLERQIAGEQRQHVILHAIRDGAQSRLLRLSMWPELFVDQVVHRHSRDHRAEHGLGHVRRARRRGCEIGDDLGESLCAGVAEFLVIVRHAASHPSGYPRPI